MIPTLCTTKYHLNQPTIERIPGVLSARVKRPRPESQLSTPPTEEVNNKCTCTFNSTYTGRTWCLIKHSDNLKFIIFPSMLLLSSTFQNPVVTLCTTMFVSENSTFCPQMYLCILHLYHQNSGYFPLQHWNVFITEMGNVYNAVRAECLNTVHVLLSLQTVKDELNLNKQ